MKKLSGAMAAVMLMIVAIHFIGCQPENDPNNGGGNNSGGNGVYNEEGHGDSKVALERWYDITENAEWKNLSDIKLDFPATDYVGNQRYVFNIKGNKYRLVVVVKFTISHVFVRFVGTHSEYEKIDVKTI